MKILITNHALDRRAGTELYVRDLAIGLKARGHEPVCFSPLLGSVAEEIRQAGIAVTDDLTPVSAPDILHCHHHPVTALACMAFPQTPAISVCHGVKPWQEAPLARFPNILAHVAVDQPCFDFLAGQEIASDTIVIIPNGVDLKRFTAAAVARDDPDRQRRALLISNIATPAELDPFRQACEANGLSLEFAGAAGEVMRAPEKDLPGYGLVFAKARAALEAMASGCAVILSDYGRIGPRVTTDRFETLRRANFGFSVIDRIPTPDALAGEIKAVDWQDAARVSARVRAEADFANAVESYEDLYLKLAGKPVDASLSPAAMQAYLGAILPQLQERDDLATRLYTETAIRLQREQALAVLRAED
ncbi:glycosyltransferase [Hyphobacterium sp. HN65]|uniref:Glycosyltransferase n=1 Tax=Hyphobacterium lacteum TaxID=3116575 RepID=A0ABU7LRS1_9PROT|nr:glycosyltransferase [Hyphobacterium sp. HN65]MEE2526609.1 glycosyltransferase [Hyphobacterium sp. HN65]